MPTLEPSGLNNNSLDGIFALEQLILTLRDAEALGGSAHEQVWSGLQRRQYRMLLMYVVSIPIVKTIPVKSMALLWSSHIKSLPYALSNVSTAFQISLRISSSCTIRRRAFPSLRTKRPNQHYRVRIWALSFDDVRLNGRLVAPFVCQVFTKGVVHMSALLILASAYCANIATADPYDTFENVPQDISGADIRKKIQRPKSQMAERCVQKCVGTCIIGGAGAPGTEGPLNIRKPLVVFKEGFRSRQYCLVECSEICNLIGDGKDGP